MENRTNISVAQEAMQQPEGDEINLMELLLVVAKHNRFILKLTGLGAVLGVVYALLQPNIYTAKTVVMPPQQASSSASALLGQLGGLAGMAGGAMGVKNPSDLYVGMLKSRSISDALIQRFHLMDLYKAKTMGPVRAALEGATTISAAKDGFITIEFSDKDPKLAAAVANAYVEELDNLAHKLSAQEAMVRKQFYEKQLKEAREQLNRSELEMKIFQEKNRVFRLGGTAMGAEAAGGGAGGMVLGASGEIPKAEIEFVRIARDVKYHEMLLGAMTQQVTSATIDAAKDESTIQVLDKASVPENKSKPKRAMIVLLVTILSLFAGIVWAFVREAGERSRQSPEQAERMNLLLRYFRHGECRQDSK